MSLTKCPQCSKEISDQAMICIHCGHPGATASSQASSPLHVAWSTVTRSRTPINVFALAMMACSAILGISATAVDGVCDLTAFTYTLHIFLAVSGMFFLTLLFCRKGMYHPDDLAKARQAGIDDLGKDNPVLAAVLIAALLAGYGVYQADVFSMPGSAQLELEKLKLCENTAHKQDSRDSVGSAVR